MDQTTQADEASTHADATGAESGNTGDLADHQTDAATVAAALAEVGSHPAVPAVLRDAWPSLMRQADRRDQQLAELAAAVKAQGVALRDLVNQLGS